MRLLFLAFLVIPIFEVWLLIQVGSLIGVLPTVALVVLTAVIGVNLLRQQGAATLVKIQQKMQQGEAPAIEMLEGLALAVGGALLLTPGFATDAIGFMCLLPFTRRKLVVGIMGRIVGSMVPVGGGAGAQSASSFFHSKGSFGAGGSSFESHFTEFSARPSASASARSDQGEVLEGEIVEGEVRARSVDDRSERLN
jgi:UPF0716 protein FxsA